MSEDKGIVKSGKEFSDALTMELTDDEIQQAMRIIVSVQQKYAGRPNNHQNLEALRDEALHKLAEIGILAQLDPAPCLYGEAPILEIMGKVQSDPIHKYGFDHEKKQWEVRKATERNEDFLGQKTRANTRKPRDARPSNTD